MQRAFVLGLRLTTGGSSWKNASLAIPASNSPRSPLAATSSAGRPTRRCRTSCSMPSSMPAISFVDTADVYSRWAPGHKGGESETVIGSWLSKDPEQARQGADRHQVRHGHAERRAGPVARPYQALGRRFAEAPEHRPHRPLPVASRRQGHADRGDALDLRRADQGGQDARWIGASNYEAPRLAEAAKVAKEKGLPQYQSLQPHYNLLERPPVRGGAGGRVPEGGPRRHPVLAAGRGLPERQVPVGGRSRQEPRAAPA